MNHPKPAKTYREQLDILKSRGLVIPDEDSALHCLSHHNYYRLSAYRFSLSVNGNLDQFLPGTTFDDLWSLYHFDRTLRQIVSEAVKRVEISVRARWAYVLGHAHGPQAYEHAPVFLNVQHHTGALARLDEELDRSEEVFVRHYREKYRMTRPPIWAACEVMSFGLLSRFYANIKRDHDRKQISTTYGMSPETLKSLLEHCVYVRNLCAHHARLWNRRFTITVKLPKSTPAAVIPNLNPLESRRLYNTLVLLVHMVGVIEPAANWPYRLAHHLQSLKPGFHTHMGFPADWRQRPTWNNLLALP